MPDILKNRIAELETELNKIRTDMQTISRQYQRLEKRGIEITAILNEFVKLQEDYDGHCCNCNSDGGEKENVSKCKAEKGS